MFNFVERVLCFIVLFQLHVNLSNLPKELCISVNWETKYFEKATEEIFEIGWCPTGVVSCRYMITFEDYKKIRRDVPVVFKAITLQVIRNL